MNINCHFLSTQNFKKMMFASLSDLLGNPVFFFGGGGCQTCLATQAKTIGFISRWWIRFWREKIDWSFLRDFHTFPIYIFCWCIVWGVWVGWYCKPRARQQFLWKPWFRIWSSWIVIFHFFCTISMYSNTRWWQLKYCWFSPLPRGDDPIWRAYFYKWMETTNIEYHMINICV